MRFGFPSYETTFPCDCTPQEAAKRIEKAAACEVNELGIEKFGYNAGTRNIVLYSGMYSGLYRNSFAPVVSLEMKEAGQGTLVHVAFALRKHIKIFTFVYCALALLLGVVALEATLIAGRTLVWPHCIPFALAAFGYMLNRVGFRYSVGRMLRVLHHSLTLEPSKHLPSVQKC